MSTVPPIVRSVLAALAEGLQCGCMPCRGECWSKDALRFELEERCDLAQQALDALGPATDSQIQCDEPLDPFTRATRDMARAS
ncbi:hypothetical protein [Methylobacterium brachythecii]|uniref:Uncharacterized protein n=1 Tax=Methylobacterium brachythecii TaxID=1176177 RepID=A0A7W6AM11_9HYPH|nr:hypothetical protein [Methylobacterium brachythecii]MBB3905081.1 hypothetical protein [Methylobacterium brachythecii]GLS44411.1 hypothetical protein GCM10007884_23990 [Methylobacterium brachythecii]